MDLGGIHAHSLAIMDVFFVTKVILLMGKSRNLIFEIVFYGGYCVDWNKNIAIFTKKHVFFIVFDDFVTTCFGNQNLFFVKKNSFLKISNFFQAILGGKPFWKTSCFDAFRCNTWTYRPGFLLKIWFSLNPEIWC